MKRPSANPVSPQRVLIFVDESNITSSAKGSNRKLDWIRPRDFLVGVGWFFLILGCFFVCEARLTLTKECVPASFRASFHQIIHI